MMRRLIAQALPDAAELTVDPPGTITARCFTAITISIASSATA